MGDANVNGEGKLTLYTSHGCPWAHRAHVVIKEMGLEYDEVLIDLDVPRPDWFLKLNPRGLVPTLTFEHPTLGKPQTIIESGLVVHFLLDTYPHLSQKIWPSPVSAETALQRYRINYFVDTYFSKVQPLLVKIMFATGTDSAEDRVNDFVNAVKEHIEPLLEDANPFVGGSSTITLAEVQTASFVLRMYDFSDGNTLPESLAQKLDELPNFSKWAKATISKESVTYIWDKDYQRKASVERMPRMRAKYGVAAK